ncbi:MAG TPA: hypothetical protein VLB45_01580 [Nitrosopumilaceae archaeon]|nr:hypothetical protein [Nitrosopumilaceae archaeon]
MASPDVAAFASWSVITAVFIVIVSLVYKKFRRQKDEPPSS